MFQYYNIHPKGLLVGDCVKRSIALAAQMDYMEVQRELNRYKKVTHASAFNTDYNPHKYVENVLHGIKMSFPAEAGKKRMTAEKFSDTYRTGSYVLNMAGHWSCCVDGVIYDTWDCSDKCVYTAYRLSNQPRKHRPPLLETMLKNLMVVRTIKSDPTRMEVKFYDRLGDVTCKKIPTTESKEYIRHKIEDQQWQIVDLDKHLLEARGQQ